MSGGAKRYKLMYIAINAEPLQGQMDIVEGRAAPETFLEAPVHVLSGPFSIEHFGHSITVSKQKQSLAFPLWAGA